MICTNNEVMNYYTERLNKNSLFNKQAKKISIHRIINLNAKQQPNYENRIFMTARGNDINLLKMVGRDKSRTFLNYLGEYKLSANHERRYYNFKKWMKKLNV